jgi:acyl carrier protein
VDNPQILAELTEIFRDVFDDDAIVVTNQTTAPDVEGWDSFNHINLVIAVENRFHIRFQVAEIEELRNVGELARLIEKKLG